MNYEDFYKKNKSMLTNYLYKLGTDKNDIEDIIQDTLFYAWQKDKWNSANANMIIKTIAKRYRTKYIDFRKQDNKILETMTISGFEDILFTEQGLKEYLSGLNKLQKNIFLGMERKQSVKQIAAMNNKSIRTIERQKKLMETKR